MADLGQSLTVIEPIEREHPLHSRMDAAIDRDWEIFSSPQFLAVIQIWMAERGNAKLFPEIQSMVRDVELHLDSGWADALQDSGLTAREISALRHVVLPACAALRCARFPSAEIPPGTRSWKCSSGWFGNS